MTTTSYQIDVMSRSTLSTLFEPLFDQYRSLGYLREPRLAALAVVHLLDVMSGSIVVPLLPSYAQRFGAGSLLLGLIFTLPAAASAVLSTPLGALADAYGRRTFIVVGLLLGSVATIGVGFAGTLPVLLVLRTFDGVGAAAAGPASKAVLGDLATNETRGRVTGAYRTVGMLGLAFGPIVGGLLADRFSLATPFVVLGVVTLAGTILVTVVLPEERVTDLERGLFDVPAVGALRGNLTAPAAALLFSALLSSVGTRAFDPMLAPLLAETTGATPSQVGFAWSAFGVSMALCLPIGGTVADRFPRRYAIVAGKSLWCLVLTTLALGTVGWLPPLALALGGVASAVSAPALGALHYEVAPDGAEGTFFGLIGAAFATGGTLGPLVYGGVAGVVDPRTVALVIAGSWLLDAVILAVALRRITASAPHTPL